MQANRNSVGITVLRKIDNQKNNFMIRYSRCFKAVIIIKLINLFILGQVSLIIAQTWPPNGMEGNGSNNDPWKITEATHLKALADFINTDNRFGSIGDSYFKLMNDVDLSDYDNWEPIGYGYYNLAWVEYRYSFRGHFDGNGKVIRNLNINRPTEGYIGLFGYVESCIIENLGVENCNIVCDQGGGLVGYCYHYSTINNCYVTGSLYGKGGGLGGLVGSTYLYPTITNCYADVEISGEGQNVGGLLGFNNYGNISNCYALGNVNGSVYVGGLVGQNHATSTIYNSYASGNVNATGAWFDYSCAGGLVGFNSWIISNCYSTGSVNGKSQVGGLVGYSGYNVSNCYATGNVSGTTDVGGLIGFISWYAEITNCIAANKLVVSRNFTSEINRIVGNDYNKEGKFFNNYALNTMEIQVVGLPVTIIDGLNTISGMSKDFSTFQSFSFYNSEYNWNGASWDISSSSSIWDMCEGKGLPFFRWQEVDCNSFTGTSKISVIPKTLVYPNPTFGMITIEIDRLNCELIRIFDLLGNEVFLHNTSDKTNQTINISHLKTGVYFLIINNETIRIIKK